MTDGQTAYNSSSNDTPSFEMDYSGRSIVFCRMIICRLIAAKNNGGVTAHVIYHYYVQL